MATATEVETKLHVDAGGYLRILYSGKLISRVDQLNAYYDDQWRLADSGATFRVRLSNGEQSKMTLKLPARWNGESRSCTEIEEPLDFGLRPPRCLLCATIPQPFGKPLRDLGIESVRRVGAMRNRRSVVQLGSVGTVELDYARLPGGIDFFEVEIESPDADARRQLAGTVRELAAGATVSHISKFERFRRAVESKRGAAR
jgi:adenylate cyclase class IV